MKGITIGLGHIKDCAATPLFRAPNLNQRPMGAAWFRFPWSAVCIIATSEWPLNLLRPQNKRKTLCLLETGMSITRHTERRPQNQPPLRFFGWTPSKCCIRPPDPAPLIRSSLTVRTYFDVPGISYSFKCFTTSAEISAAVFFTVFSGAFFSRTNFAAAT